MLSVWCNDRDAWVPLSLGAPRGECGRSPAEAEALYGIHHAAPEAGRRLPAPYASVFCTRSGLDRRAERTG